MPERELEYIARLFDMAINRDEKISLAESESGIAEVKVEAVEGSVIVDKRLRRIC